MRISVPASTATQAVAGGCDSMLHSGTCTRKTASDPFHDRGTEGPGVPRFGFHWEGKSQSSNLLVFCSRTSQRRRACRQARAILGTCSPRTPEVLPLELCMELPPLCHIPKGFHAGVGVVMAAELFKFIIHTSAVWTLLAHSLVAGVGLSILF